jgi:SPP1 gp7 family putative phage head morphogenesis protein
MGEYAVWRKGAAALMTEKLYALGNGIKSIPLDQLHSWAEFGNVPWATGRVGEKGVQELASTVAFLYRGIEMRASSLAVIPWSIYRAKGEDTVWSSEDPMPPPELQGFADLQEILYRTEASLCLVSAAYLARLRNRIRTAGIQWLDPNTMTPMWTPQGLTHFQRASMFDTRNMPTEDVIYIWQKGLSEIYPKRSPAYAALAAANSLNALDAFVASFFSRGAVKATLLTVKQQPLPAEANRLKAWWMRTVSGMRNAFASEVISAEVEPVVIGEGISELSNTDLSQEKREDISTALGVPHSLLMSDAANMATAESDRKNFYEMTVLPQANLIERQLNAQLWMPMGLRMTFAPQEMGIFQEDETRRAEAFATYVAAGIKPSIAAELLGVELPEGFTYVDLDTEPPIVVQEVGDQQSHALPELEDNADEKEAERKRFVRWAKKRANPCAEDFKSTILSDADKEALLGDMGIVPFGMTGGMYTPDAVKAMILQLDPDDPEAEQKIRMGLEGKSAKTLRQAFLEMYETLMPGAMTFADEAAQLAEMERLIRTDSKVRDAIERMLVDSADLGVSVAVSQLEGVGYGMDWTMPNTQAREWAKNHVGTLVQGIDQTNLNTLREAAARWIGNGEPLQSLIDDLAPLFGRSRAEMIAATEITKAFFEANQLTWKASEVVGEMVWQTAADERVCPICGALHGETVELGQSFRGSHTPPAHPRCRCWVAPVLKPRGQ